MNETVIFHIAFPVGDIQTTKEFYINKLACIPGRETSASLILNFYGHQLVAHITKEKLKPVKSIYPRHFGLIFKTEKNWLQLEKHLRDQNIEFYDKPKQRFIGKATEHRTMFIEDPFHNLWEFKFYKHEKAIFGNQEIKEIGDQI
jgi:uncharacterized protein